MERDYQEYVGKTVLVTSSERTMSFGNPKEEIVVKDYDVSEEDSTIEEIRKGIGNLRLRVWLPDTVGTMDYRLDRLNVYVRESDDGTYKVTKVALG